MSAKSLFKILTINAIVFLMNFSLKAQLTADFTASPTTGCAPFQVNFTNTSTGGATSWEWNLGNSATIITLQNPQTFYVTPGLYSVTLTVKDAVGNISTKTKTNYITAYAKPAVNFTATPNTGCFILPVQFTDNSSAGSGTITSWLWDFGDGTAPNTSQNPVHTYTSQSSFNVTLTVTNSNGCTFTYTKPAYVVVGTNPKALFTNTLPTGCTAPETITFQNQSTGLPLTYQWDFGDAGAGFNPTSFVLNPTHSYAAGNYMATLVVTNNLGCTDTIRHPIVIGSVVANFTLPATACVGEAVNFTNTSLPSSSSVLWDFGDFTNSTTNNPIKTYTTPGNYIVTLTSFLGACQGTTTKPITIFSKQTTSFSGAPLTACKPPLTVNFTNTSIGATSYEWHFGDGGTSTLENPSHTYVAAGIFNDTLITTNANGCKDTIIKSGYVKIVPPTVSITNLPKSGCAPLANTFSASVSSIDGIVGYEWFANNVLFSTTTNPTQIFAAGNYDIKLVITTTGGCTDTFIVSNGIRAGLKPTPNFSALPTSVCAFMPVQFTDLSTPVPPSAIDFWDWEFGDGVHSSDPNPSHIFEDTGHFSITLIVGNNDCKDTITFIDYIYVKPPIALFDVVANCNSHFSRDFVDHSIGADTWAWNFGDIASGVNNTSVLANPTHIFSAPGSYNISLTVTNIATGCSYTKPTTVVIANEFANFTASTLEFCKNNATTFTATSVNAVSQIVNYVWDFGDLSAAGSGAIVSHTYTQVGSYSVKLIITDVNGCSDTLLRPNYINVYGSVANFIPSPVGACVLTNINYSDQTITDGIHPISTWTWTFGDNGTNTETFTAPPFIHAYTNAGVYTVKLLVQDSFGCLDSITKVNVVTISSPAAIFSSNDTASCPGKTVTFINESTGPNLSYVWNFGDPLSGANNTSTATTPSHIYNQDGNYTVTLTVTDQYNCTSVKIRTQYVKIATPIADFTINNISGTCPPVNATFLNTSQNGISYLWTFGDGPASSTNFNSFHTYNTVGIFPATLTVTSAGGCTAIKTTPISVQGPSGTFSYSPLAGCSPLTVNFTTNIVSAFTVDFDYNDGIVSNSNTHNYTLNIIGGSLVGDFVPTMILKDAAGCIVPVVGVDTIKVKGVIPDFTQDTLLRCGNGAVNFTSSYLSNDLPIASYLWDFGDLSPTSALANPTHIYTTPGLYYPKLTITSNQNCVATKIAPVATKVVKVPDITFVQPANKCAPSGIVFNGSNLVVADTSAITWSWSFANGTNIVNANGITTPTINFNIPGIYLDTLIAINSSGCRDTATGSFEIYPKPIVDAGNDITICKGTGQILTPSGANTYVWSPALGLSCTNCTLPTAMPDSVKTYTVTGTSVQGCTNTDSVKVAVQYPFKMQHSLGDTLCTGENTKLFATGANTYIWSPTNGLNTTTGTNVVASPTTDTRYMVIGTDDKNCFKDTAYFPVKVYPIPTVNAGIDKIINVGQSVTLTPTLSADITSVIWTPSTWLVSNSYPSITVKPSVNTEYKVSVSNPGGCKSSDLVTVNVLCDGANFFIPNTFSPNNDGANDIFYPRGTGLFTIKLARIFNRWGEEVYAKYSFKPNDPNVGWNGTHKGNKLSPDVFVYLFEIQCDNGSTLIYKGNITLIK